MIEPEQFFWRGWDYDSFFDADIQTILMRMHPGDIAANDPSFQQRWAFPVMAWKALDQFRHNVASGLAQRTDADGWPEFQLCDFDMLAALKLSPMWFFELGTAVFNWKNASAKRFNDANANRKKADIRAALEYWRTTQKAPSYGDIQPTEKWGEVVWELKQLGFSAFTDHALRQCVKREDDRRRSIVEKWSQGFASSLNFRVGKAAITAKEYRESFAAARDRKR